MTRQIAVTFDYRCPFARNGHEAIVNALRGGADLDIRFVPFSLDQAHVPEGEPPMWERPRGEWGTGTTALLYGIAVRDSFPDQFLDAHLALFAVRHDHGKQLGHEDVVREAVASVGLDVDAVGEVALSGGPLETLASEHQEMVQQHAVFGVPTFVEADQAVFIRYMERGRVDDLERSLDLL
ncbi:MAG: DsbA family oxidoreductase, partial [Acidimicrobiia bacterium]